MYEITNKSKEVRKFRESNTGKDVYLNPGCKAYSKKPIPSSEIFDVQRVLKKRPKKIIKLEDDKE